MKNKQLPTYTKQYIDDLSSSEIDFVLYDELYGKAWSDEDYEDFDFGDFKVKDESKCPWAGNSYPTNLDKLIKDLKDMKSRGCTHIEIMYHEDHIGYEISGLKFTKNE